MLFLNLLKVHGSETKLSDEMEKQVTNFKSENLSYDSFDFHHYVSQNPGDPLKVQHALREHDKIKTIYEDSKEKDLLVTP